MSPMLKFALPIALLLAIEPAHAQMLGLWWDTNVTLTQADLDIIKGDLANQIHNKKLGTTASWSNPASGNSGSITLVKVFARQGQRCEQIDYRMSPPEKTKPSDRYVLTSCMSTDGSWKLSY
jgi:hypothetical protein